MEQSLRLLLSGANVSEQTLLNVVNKLTSSSGRGVASDLFILTAERLFDLPPPLQRHIVDKADQMITIYNRLQEPPNQFQIRALICQSLICSYRSRSQRGTPATEWNLKSVDFMLRALKLIQANSLYQPLGLRAVFLFNQIAFPFFPKEQRHHLQTIAPLAVAVLEPHVNAGKLDPPLRLYISLSLLMGCLLDDQGKSDEASRQIQKLFTFIPTDLVQLRYSLLHILVHFARRSSGGLAKVKLDLNEQLQRAVVLYQTARSNNVTMSKDLAEVLKICSLFLDSRKEASDETYEAEIIIGETGRLAAQFGQTQVAEDCLAKASSARSPLARLHATLTSAELGLAKQLTAEEHIEFVNSCNHVMSLAMYQGDLVTVQDAAALLWSHALHVLDHPQAIKRTLISSVDILAKINSQVNVLRSQMHFAIAKILEKEKDNMKALDHLKRAMALDYLTVDHPTKLIHPFDRFLVPYFRMLNTQLDSYGEQGTVVEKAHALIALPKKVNPQSLQNAFDIIRDISPEDVSAYDPLDAAHFANIWLEVIKNASLSGVHKIAVEGTQVFTALEFDPVRYDAVVELQCEACVYGIQSCFRKDPDPQVAVQFTVFAIEKAKALKILRLSYNAIAAIWTSFFSHQPPLDCAEYLDFLNDCVTHLFESDFPDAKLLIGQLVNFYVQVILAQPNEQPVAVVQGKKKPAAVDPTKQKQLKSAEDLLIKALPIIKSIIERKALVDRMVEIFGKRNAFPPNQSDPENAILLTLATILNEKVQHKQETLSTTFTQIQNLPTQEPVLYALLAEKACKVDLHQVAIDSAGKTLELIPNPSGKDELYHSALARFARGLTFVKLIQPELQEFSCQDKLRHDAAYDLLKAAIQFHDAVSLDNAKQALSFFVSTISVGESYPKFRSLLSDVLVEAIDISRKVIISDELRVRLFRIYVLALIDQSNWTQCRKAIKQVISTLDRSVHCHIWDLNLVVTAKSDCAQTEQPLIDEMLRVKQLGDSKYQSRLWSFVADLATDPNVQRTALTKAIDCLTVADVEERFQTAMNLCHWLRLRNEPWSEIQEALHQAEVAIGTEAFDSQVEYQFEMAEFVLSSTADPEVFENTVANVKALSDQLWSVTSVLNSSDEDEQGSTKTQKISGRRDRVHRSNNKIQMIEEVKAEPTNIAEWVKALEQADHRKAISVRNPFRLTEVLLRICDILENLGEEYALLKIWSFIIQFSKLYIQWPRYEQLLFMKLKVFLDRINVVSPFDYSSDFTLTEAEKGQWQQIVGRYQTDPPSTIHPLRKILIREAEILVKLGEYKPALLLLNSALAQSEELNDNDTKARSICLLAAVKARSGEMQNAIEFLATAAKLKEMPMDFWVTWYSTGFLLQKSDFTEAMLNSFQMNCLKDDLTIHEQIQVYQLYRTACPYLSPEAALEFFKRSIKKSYYVGEGFLPTFDTITAFYWRALMGNNFPKSLPEFKSLGHELLHLIKIISDKYDQVMAHGEDEALPVLCRVVDIINMFGSLVLRFNPVIRGIETNGLDLSAIGSHASLLNDFIDKTQEPLQDLSPTAAILHFNTVQNAQNIPEKYQVRMNVYLGQCLHCISTDNVTLQNAVKYLWKGVELLTQLEQYELAGEIASELYGILRSSDSTGAIFQYMIAQAALAYRQRIHVLFTESEPTNRELLFVNESERLRNTFLNPQISQMYLSSQKYFEQIQNGTSLMKLGKTMDQIKQFIATNNNGLIVMLDNLRSDEESLTAAVISLGPEGDKLDSIVIDISVDEFAMKYEIFKQIIATQPGAPRVVDTEAIKKAGTPARASRSRQRKPAGKAQVVVPEEKPTSFASEALKTNNPEFQKFIADLDEAFEPLKALLPEKVPETVFVISSRRATHVLPLDCVSAFSSFTTIYHDFSIMSLLNRKGLCLGEPDYGNVN